MENQLPARSLAAQSISLPTASVREQSTSTLATAIHSGKNPGETLRRANLVLALYFDPDLDPETKAHLRQEFVVALKDFPDWAVQKAFDAWVKMATRRPSPGEIVILAARETEIIQRELDIRTREAARQAEDERNVELTPEQLERRREVAARAMITAGFTEARTRAIKAAPMALTFADAEAKIDKPSNPHWSDAAAPDDPRWEMLRKSRAENPLIQACIARTNADRKATQDPTP